MKAFIQAFRLSEATENNHPREKSHSHDRGGQRGAARRRAVLRRRATGGVCTYGEGEEVAKARLRRAERHRTHPRARLPQRPLQLPTRKAQGYPFDVGKICLAAEEFVICSFVEQNIICFVHLFQKCIYRNKGVKCRTNPDLFGGSEWPFIEQM